MLDIAGLANLLLVPLALIPLILNLRYYFRTKIKDYLYLSIYFVLWSIILAIEIWYYGFEIYSISWKGTYSGSVPEPFRFIMYNVIILLWEPLDALPLLLVGLRAKYGNQRENYPKWIIILIMSTVIFVLIALFDQEKTMTHQDVFATNLAFWAAWIARLVLYGLVAYTFLTTEFSKTKKAVRSRNLWIYSSILWVIAMIGFITGGIMGYDQQGSNSFLDLWTSFAYTTAAVLIFYNHVAHPESVLITHEQIHMAFNLYDKIELKGNLISDFGVSRVVSYLDQLPQELKELLKADRSIN